MARRHRTRQPDRRLQIRRPVPGADRQKTFDARRTRCTQDLIAVAFESFAVEMTMGVDQHVLRPRLALESNSLALFDCLERRPAALPGVGNVGVHAGELLIGCQHIGSQIE